MVSARQLCVHAGLLERIPSLINRIHVFSSFLFLSLPIVYASRAQRVVRYLRDA